MSENDSKSTEKPYDIIEDAIDSPKDGLVDQPSKERIRERGQNRGNNEKEDNKDRGEVAARAWSIMDRSFDIKRRALS
jgi:hypothetical protein